MAEEKAKQMYDYTDEVEAKIPEFLAPVKKNPGNDEILLAAATNLLTLEKKTRLAADLNSTKKLASAVLALFKDAGKWKQLNEHILLLSKRRAQLSKVVSVIITDSMAFLDDCKDRETRRELIKTLRVVSAGKMFAELERARLTRMLAQMEEEDKDLEKAALTLQEVQVETVGSMEPKEKCEFLLEQMRLCLATNDNTRAEILSNKVDKKKLKDEGFGDLKLTFYRQAIELYEHTNDYLQICKAHLEMFQTPKVQEDEKAWTEALSNAALFAALSPFDSETSDLLHRIKAESKLASLPAAHALLEKFTAAELLNWPLAHEKEYKQNRAFADKEKGEGRWKDFHKRAVQHNIRVVGGYYQRINAARLAALLRLDVDQTETFLSEMVSSKQLFAKVDRPSGIITFQRNKSPNDVLNAWAHDVSDLLTRVEATCHLIAKQNMLHGIK